LRERQREHELWRDRGRGRLPAECGPHSGSLPGPRDRDLGQGQTLDPLSHPGTLRENFKSQI